jgi:hypothetical protein
VHLEVSTEVTVCLPAAAPDSNANKQTVPAFRTQMAQLTAEVQPGQTLCVHRQTKQSNNADNGDWDLQQNNNSNNGEWDLLILVTPRLADPLRVE